MNTVLIFPVCVKALGEIFKVYLPDIDMEYRASDFADVFSKTRKLLKSALVTKEIRVTDLQGDLCSEERVRNLLRRNHKEAYLNERILCVDLSLYSFGGPGAGELPITLPFAMIEAIREEGLEFGKIAETALCDALHRKSLLRDAKELLGQTVRIATIQGDCYGVLKRIHPLDSLDFTINLQTGVHAMTRIHASAIEEIGEEPVVMNEMGTFHLINQLGLVSIMGQLWWYRDHIDVYLEYDSLLDMENQKALEYLSDFNQVKYEMDAAIREGIASYLSDSYVLPLLFPNERNNPEEHKKQSLAQLKEKLDLWFVNISLIGSISMDYNFSNEIGSFTIGVDTDLENKKLVFNMRPVELFDDGCEKDDDYDDEDREDWSEV